MLTVWEYLKIDPFKHLKYQLNLKDQKLAKVSIEVYWPKSNKISLSVIADSFSWLLFFET